MPERTCIRCIRSRRGRLLVLFTTPYKGSQGSCVTADMPCSCTAYLDKERQKLVDVGGLKPWRRPQDQSSGFGPQTMDEDDHLSAVEQEHENGDGANTNKIEAARRIDPHVHDVVPKPCPSVKRLRDQATEPSDGTRGTRKRSASDAVDKEGSTTPPPKRVQEGPSSRALISRADGVIGRMIDAINRNYGLKDGASATVRDLYRPIIAAKMIGNYEYRKREKKKKKTSIKGHSPLHRCENAGAGTETPKG